MDKETIHLLRYAIPALAGTLLGIWLEKNVWKGR
jgi:hypothetical protein